MDWAALDRSFRARVALRPARGRALLHYGARLLLSLGTLALAWCGMHLFDAGPRPLWWLLGGLGMVQCGMLGHDLGHGYLGRGRRMRRLVGHLLVTAPTGLGFDPWCQQHSGHHRRTHHAHDDPDLQVAALALSPEHVAAGPAQRVVRRAQGLWFWLAPMLQPFNMRLDTWVAVLRRPSAVALLTLGVHYVLWLVLPVALLGRAPGAVVLDWAAHSALGGIYMAAVFFVNHLGRPTWTGPRPHAMEIALRSTRNLPGGPLWTVFTAGLNHHAEHHLMPAVPTHQLGAVRVALQGACAEHGVPYPQQRLLPALADVYRFVWAQGRQAR